MGRVAVMDAVAPVFPEHESSCSESGTRHILIISQMLVPESWSAAIQRRQDGRERAGKHPRRFSPLKGILTSASPRLHLCIPDRTVEGEGRGSYGLKKKKKNPAWGEECVWVLQMYLERDGLNSAGFLCWMSCPGSDVTDPHFELPCRFITGEERCEMIFSSLLTIQVRSRLQ